MDVLSCVICTYVFTPHSIRPPELSDKLCSIQADFNDVVEQSERWRQREGGHEQSHKPILDYCKTHKVKEACCVIAVVSEQNSRRDSLISMYSGVTPS